MPSIFRNMSKFGLATSVPRWRSVPIAALALCGGCLLWSYWPTLLTMWDRWSDDPQYSHGFLVPVFALAILWSRREQRPRSLAAPAWWGLGLLAAAVLLRFTAAYFYLEPLDGLSLLPLLAGLCVLLA